MVKICLLKLIQLSSLLVLISLSSCRRRGDYLVVELNVGEISHVEAIASTLDDEIGLKTSIYSYELKRRNDGLYDIFYLVHEPVGEGENLELNAYVKKFVRSCYFTNGKEEYVVEF